MLEKECYDAQHKISAAPVNKLIDYEPQTVALSKTSSEEFIESTN